MTYNKSSKTGKYSTLYTISQDPATLSGHYQPRPVQALFNTKFPFDLYLIRKQINTFAEEGRNPVIVLLLRVFRLYFWMNLKMLEQEIMRILILFTWLNWHLASASYHSDYRFYQKEHAYDIPLQLPSKDSSRHWLCFILGLCSMTFKDEVNAETPNLKVIYQWNQLEFDYNSPQERQRDIDSGEFTPGVIAPIDVDVYYSPTNKNNHIFVTIPKFMAGIPATIGTVTHKELNGNPLIRPYPDWNWHRRARECHKDRIVSVFRVKVDECGKLWVLDTGKIGSNVICPPQLLAFDLNTNTLLHRYNFPQEVVTNQHLLVTPIVDVRDFNSGCRDTFVYVADVLGFALIVYDLARNISWRIQDKTFYPYPNYGTYSIAGDSFDLMDGILGMTLSPYIPGQDRVLFYHAMSSPTENWVFTSYLRNQTIFQHDPMSAPHIFHTYANTRSSQTAAEAIDKDGTMFFGLMEEIQIACWNIRSEYGLKNFDVIAQNPLTLQFPSGIKIIRNKKGEQELWILTSRFQKLANGSLNPREPNFRIQAGKVEDLVYGKKCRSKHTQQNQVNGGGYGFYTPQSG